MPLQNKKPFALPIMMATLLLTGCGSSEQKQNDTISESIFEVTNISVTEPTTSSDISVSTTEIVSDNTQEITTTEETYIEQSFFDEVNSMLTPDSAISGIEYVSRDEQNGVILYMYKLDKDQVTANKLYQEYQLLLADHFNVTTDNNSIVYVEDKGSLVSAIQSGYDENLGYFIMVSFPSA